MTKRKSTKTDMAQEVLRMRPSLCALTRATAEIIRTRIERDPPNTAVLVQAIAAEGTRASGAMRAVSRFESDLELARRKVRDDPRFMPRPTPEQVANVQAKHAALVREREQAAQGERR